MYINFTGDNIEITEALHNLIEKKFKRIETHYNHKITTVNVILSVEKLANIAEMTVFVPGQEINAKAKADDMYKAIDQMLNKINRQLIKHKEKITDHH